MSIHMNVLPTNRLGGRIFSLARLAAIVLAVALSLLAIYTCVASIALVYKQPELILPNATFWNASELYTALIDLGLPAWFFAAYALGFNLVFSLTFLGVGWLILWRKNQDWFGLYLSLLFMGWATSSGTSVSIPIHAAWFATVETYMAWLLWPGFFLLFYFFPSGHVTPRWTRWFALAIGLLIFYGWIVTLLNIELGSLTVWAPLILACLIVGGYSQIYRYRHAGLVERQQVKIVVLALLLFVLYMGLSFWIGFSKMDDPLTFGQTSALLFGLVSITIGSLAFMGLPIAITLAILRYHLWDVDVILRRTLTYGALTASLALVFFGVVTLVQNLFQAVSGQQSAVSIVISTLAIAALFSPLRKRIQNDIDRRFFRKKYNAEKTLEGFAALARTEVSLEELTNHLQQVIEETIQPMDSHLWLMPFGNRPKPSNE